MAESKKALAELAKWLKQLVDANGGKNCRAVANIDKAQRIVAELAKVEMRIALDVNDVYRLQLVSRPNQDQAIAAIENCRAIAEEGVKDGK